VSSPERVSVPFVSTGHLPNIDAVSELLTKAHSLFADLDEGKVADYIPALAQTDPRLFGIAVVGCRGPITSIGDCAVRFSIQSVSKAFVSALVLDAVGPTVFRERIGVNASGMPFDSVIAVELHPDRTANPLVNAGAIATTSLVPGVDSNQQWEFVRSGLSKFAGRELDVDEVVYASESATNERNRGIAHLLYGYGRLYSDAESTVDRYTKQCSIAVTAVDLATMAATLANGGVHPVTGTEVVSAETARRSLSVMATAGLYEESGDWLFEVGLPGKSGVSGAVVTVAPGKGGLAVFSPPLDQAGNSVRGVQVTEYLSHSLGLDLFASTPFEESLGH
jgi:glutaminase